MRSMLLVTAIACTIATASSARAQPDEYVRLSAAGVAASTAGRHEEAYALFEQAHAVFPNARSSRAMGATAFQLRRYTDAIEHYEAALGDERRALTDEQRAQADGELIVARRLVGSARVRVSTPGASATIDDDVVAIDTSHALDPGPHVLVVSAVGYARQTRAFTTRSGEEHAFEIALDPVARASVIDSGPVRSDVGATARAPAAPRVVLAPRSSTPRSAPVVTTAAEVDARPAGSVLDEWWFWTVLGVVAVGAGVGIGAGVASSGTTAEAPFTPPSGLVVTTLSGP